MIKMSRQQIGLKSLIYPIKPIKIKDLRPPKITPFGEGIETC